MISKIRDILKSKFPKFYGFISIQEKAIKNVLEKDSTLVIAPTGCGKSLIYYVSAVALGGVCIVISPLIALIIEQTEKLRNYGFNVLSFYSTETQTQKNKDLKTLKSFAKGEIIPTFIFVSPERIANDGFMEFCFKKQKDKIKLIVIDEVHCISQWGFDFRPFYKRIPHFLNSVFDATWPKLLAMTATLNPKEQNDVCQDFDISHDSIVRELNRPLRLDIDINVLKTNNKQDLLFKLIEDNKSKKILIYHYKKYDENGVEDLCKLAKERGFNAEFFHSDIEQKKKESVLEEFKNGHINIVFATNAFGMGIDIPDIEIVIHYMIPESVEQFYQEIGRAGRNGLGAKSFLLYSQDDVKKRKNNYINKSFLTEKEIKTEYEKQIHGDCEPQSINLFEEDKFSLIFNSLLECHALEFIAKGLLNLEHFEINNKQIKDYCEKVLRKSIKNIVYANNLKIIDLMDIIYNAFLNEEITTKKTIPNCIFIKANDAQLTNEHLSFILNYQDERKKYKHELLDKFVQLLDEYKDSITFHQAIGHYLGVSHFDSKRIHITERGDMVRSKSEVIIANILFRSGVDYKYEENLQYSDNQTISPDFTIYQNGKIYYWEHLGMLDNPNYAKHWQEKMEIYKKLNLIDYLIITEDNPNLSKIVNHKIDIIKTLQ